MSVLSSPFSPVPSVGGAARLPCTPFTLGEGKTQSRAARICG